MKSTKILSLTFMLFWVVFSSFSQKYSLNNELSFLTVTGTSTLHDWTIQVKEQSGEIIFSEPLQIQSLKLAVRSESMDSGKKGMDKKTYKALETDKYDLINFKFKKVKSMVQGSDNTYSVVLIGDLTVTGKTNEIEIQAEVTKKDKMVIIDGKYSLKMTDYNIEPPKALLGAIKTGNEVTINFKTIFSK